MSENKQERFGAGSGVRAEGSAGVSGEVRFAAGPGDRGAGVDGGAAQRSRPPDRGGDPGGHPGGAGSSVSLATEVSPATRDRDLEARRESGVSAGSGGCADGAAVALRRPGEGIGAGTLPGAEEAAGAAGSVGVGEPVRLPGSGEMPSGTGAVGSVGVGEHVRLSGAGGEVETRLGTGADAVGSPTVPERARPGALDETEAVDPAGTGAVDPAGAGEPADLARSRRSARRCSGASRSAKRAKPVTSHQEERRPAGAVDVAVEDIDTFVVDCDRCAVRGAACADCVVSVLLGPPVELVWDADERRAVDALAEAGMVPRLRLVPESDSRSA